MSFVVSYTHVTHYAVDRLHFQKHSDKLLQGHVFIPAAIYLGIERLMIQRDAHMLDMQFLEESSIGEGLDGCLEILRKIQSVNNLAKYYLNLLDSGQLGDSRPLQP